MDKRTRRATQLAIQFDNYRQEARPWSGDFDADTLSRVIIILTPSPAGPANPSTSPSTSVILPSSEDPFPPSWPIDRSILNKAVKDFLRLTSHLAVPSSITPLSSEPTCPLGRPRPKRTTSKPPSSPASIPQSSTSVSGQPTAQPAAVIHLSTPQSSTPISVGAQATAVIRYAHRPATTRRQPRFSPRPDSYDSKFFRTEDENSAPQAKDSHADLLRDDQAEVQSPEDQQAEVDQAEVQSPEDQQAEDDQAEVQSPGTEQAEDDQADLHSHEAGIEHLTPERPPVQSRVRLTSRFYDSEASPIAGLSSLLREAKLSDLPRKMANNGGPGPSRNNGNQGPGHTGDTPTPAASPPLPGFDMAQFTELIEKAVQTSLRNNANALRGPQGNQGPQGE